MTSLEQIVERGFEQVSFFSDDKHSLRGLVAIHSTKLGPALGGCRMRPYAKLEDALLEAMNLAEAMTYKNALCGINFGGGKSVLITEPNFQDGRKEYFQAFGRYVDNLCGSYVTGGDMGSTVYDMQEIKKSTPFVSGADPLVGFGGDPSPYTARGVFAGMRACLERKFSSSSFQSKKVAIQGVGKTGYYLAELLAEAGAQLFLADVDSARVAEVAKKFSASVVAPCDIHKLEVDIFSPSAMGGILNEQSIKELRCKIVAGSANVQLVKLELETELRNRKILYAPDFAINAGGVIFCAEDFQSSGKIDEPKLLAKIARIQNTIAQILERAEQSGELAQAVALEMAKERIAAA